MYKLILPLCALLLAGCEPREYNPSGKFKTMMIKSTGEVETLPDQASFRIHLNCLEYTVKTSKDCLVQKSNDLNNRLLSLGIKKNDILTTSVDLHKEYVWFRNSQTFKGYNSSTTVYVTVKDLDKLDEIYTELLENQNLEIGSLSYTHSKLDSLKNEAYLKALKNSQTLADRLMTGLPEKKKEILKIGNVALTSTMPDRGSDGYASRVTSDAAVMEETAAQAGNQSVSISRGTVKVHAELFVEYQLK